jgi:LPXTG-motif cell wall-anchored protein
MKFSPVSFLRSSLAVLILLLAAYGHAHAGPQTPEIDTSLSIGGLALLSGVVLLVRGRRRP